MNFKKRTIHSRQAHPGMRWIKQTLHEFLTGKIFPTLLLVSSVALSPTAAASPAIADAAAAREALTWHSDFDEAAAEAAKEDKILLVRFTAEWCAPCRVMDASVWPEEKTQAALAENFILLKSDIDESAGRDLARRFGVRGVPTLVLLDAAESELARGGFMSAEGMVRFLRGVQTPDG